MIHLRNGTIVSVILYTREGKFGARSDECVSPNGEIEFTTIVRDYCFPRW